MSRGGIKLFGSVFSGGKGASVFVASLLLAAAIWLLHNLSLNYSAPMSASIVARSNIPGRFQESVSPVIVEARCRATGFKILRNRRLQRRGPVVVWFDPEVFKETGDDIFSISASELSGYVDKIFGSDVQLESFASPGVSFRFTRENHKKVPVRLMRNITFKPQYMALGDVSVKPDSVIIYGEEKYIEMFGEVLTRPLELSGVSASRSGTVALDVPKSVRVSSQSVDYQLDVVRFVEMRRTVKVQGRGVPDGRHLEIFPSVADLVIRRAFPASGTPEDEIGLYIDYRDFNSSRTGRCVARISGLTPGILSCVPSPEVFDCVETGD